MKAPKSITTATPSQNFLNLKNLALIAQRDFSVSDELAKVLIDKVNEMIIVESLPSGMGLVSRADFKKAWGL